MGFGLLCIIFGTLAIVAHKNTHNNSHFVSAHAVNTLPVTSADARWLKLYHRN